jgi:type IV pilus biogenesis/stability protein PilW
MLMARWVCAALALAAACSSGPTQDDTAKSDFHYRLARNYYNDPNIAMVQRELHEALKLDPRNHEALHLRGFVRMGLNDLLGAEADYKAALGIKPDFQECRNNLGTALLALGRFEEAIEVFKPLLEDPLYPTPSFAQGNIGFAYMNLKNFEAARRHMEMAVFLNPRFCVGYNNLGKLFLETRNPRAARDAFERATRTCPTYAEPWYHLGVMLQESGESAKAAEAFLKCNEASPETAIGQRCAARR